jgi:hypothetical protein
MLSNELAESTIISIGKPGRDGGFFSRILHLEVDSDGHALRALRPPRQSSSKGSGRAESAA